ncbi:Negative regulator of SacY activity [compost metagenome]
MSYEKLSEGILNNADNEEIGKENADNNPGSWVSSAVAFLFDHAAPLAGLFLGGTFSILMIMGMHYALLPIMMLNLAENGFDHLTLIWLAANFAQGAAAIAVFWMTKNKSCKPVFLASGILARLGGPEPAIYGVNLRFRKPFLAGMIGSAIAGLFLTVFQIKSYSIYSGPEWLPIFLRDADVYGILGLLLAFVVPFAVLYFIKFEDSPLVTE